MKSRLAPCGTYGGYQRHKRRAEPACEPCREANAQYMRGLRTDPEFYSRDLARNAARQRAYQRLADEYPRRFLELLNEERAAAHATEAKP